MSCMLSRRSLIAGAATGLITLSPLAGRPAAADESGETGETKEADKIKQPDAHYQAHPNGQQRCEICLQFSPPSRCQIVQAPITAQGWCQYFAARDNAT